MSAGAVGLIAASVARSVADRLVANELFADLGPRGSHVPGMIGAGAAGLAMLCFAVPLIAMGGPTRWLAVLPLAVLPAFLVRPSRQTGRAPVARSPSVRCAATPLRVFAAGLFSPSRVLAALAALFLGWGAGRAAVAQGASGAGIAACAMAAVTAGGLMADPARWPLAAWRYDGTRTLAKAGRPALIWLCAVSAMSAVIAGSFAGGLAAAGLGAAFLVGRIAYAAKDSVGWRDGAVISVAAAAAASVMPPALVAVAGGAGVTALRRARQRIAPRV